MENLHFDKEGYFHISIVYELDISEVIVNEGEARVNYRFIESESE